MDTARKKELRDNYKEKKEIGGICGIKCLGNQRICLKHTKDIDSLRNRYDFAMMTNTCPEPLLRSEWMEYGNESFSFIVMEELERGKTQTDREYANDIKDLYELWLEKLEKGELEEDYGVK